MDLSFFPLTLEAIDTTLSLTDFVATLVGERSGLKLRLAGSLLKFAFDGYISHKPTLRVEGTLAADTASLRDTLHYLRTALDAPVPAEVVAALAAAPVTAQDREFYRRKISRRGLLGEIPLMWSHYCLLAGARQRPATRAG